MSLIQFIRLLKNHATILIIAPILVALSVFLLMDDSTRTYSTTCRIYTGFASGVSLKNNAQRDFYGIKTKFDNFFESTKSRSTKEEILLKTLAFYLSAPAISPKDLSVDNQKLLFKVFDAKLKAKIPVTADVNQTYLNLSRYYHKNFDNEVYLILNEQHSPLSPLFSSENLSNLEAKQEGTSDLVILQYESIDAGLTYRIMKIAVEVLLSKVKVIKSAESNDVVKYFMEEVKKAQKKLDDAEQELGNLLTQNNITNYYEQTKWLASRNEDFVVAFQKEKLGLAAAEAAEKEAIVTMGISNGIKFKTGAVLDLRNEISEINSKIAEMELKNQVQLRTNSFVDSTEITKPKQQNLSKIQALQEELAKKENQLKTEIDEMLSMKNTASGIQLKDVANKWLEAVIQVEEYEARIIQYIQFEKEFEVTYSRLAKLGSLIKQLERKIAVYEQDYLGLLASLNEARLVEENIQMSSNLKIVDHPYYPLNAEKSKKMMVVIIGALAGLVLCLSILLLMEYLDNTIKTADRLKQFTALNLIGAYPILPKKQDDNHTVLLSKISKQISTFINFCFYEKKEAHLNFPFKMLFYSTRKQEGKTSIIQNIAKELISAGENTLYVNCSANSFKIWTNNGEQTFSYPSNFYDFSVNELFDIANLNLNSYRYLLIEIPPIIGNDLPIQLIKSSDLNLLVSKANRIWNKADAMALSNFLKISSTPSYTIINGVSLDELENTIGEIPKKRSAFRKFIKRLASLQFKTNPF